MRGWTWKYWPASGPVFKATTVNNPVYEVLLTRLFNGVVVGRPVFKNNPITLSPCFTFIPETGLGLSKKWATFYCGNELLGLVTMWYIHLNVCVIILIH